MNLEYEPSTEPLLISANEFYFKVVILHLGTPRTAHPATTLDPHLKPCTPIPHNLRPHSLDPKPQTLIHFTPTPPNLNPNLLNPKPQTPDTNLDTEPKPQS